ncbi:MAG: hypothetical protein ACOZCL_08245 [Bacillota bacterium]
MYKESLIAKTFILFIVLIVSISLCSCGAQKKPMLNNTKDKQEEKEPPKELEKLKKSVEKVEKSLQPLYDKAKMPPELLEEEITKKLEEEKKKGGEEGGEQKKQGSEGSKTGEQQKKPAPEEIKKKMEQELLKSMEDIKKDVLGLHEAWSAYEPKAVADLASPTAVTDFEASLNNLTASVEAKDVFESLVNTNELYKSLPDFYVLYKAKAPPEIDKLRYGVKKIKLSSDVKSYDRAKEGMEYLNSTWSITKPKLKKNNLDIINKFEFAMTDLKTALEEQNSMIINAKSEVLLKIADEMEKAAEKEGS